MERYGTARQNFRAADGFQLTERTKFITQDEIDRYFFHRSLDHKLGTYSFFLQNSDKKDRANYLKEQFGVGGAFPALMSNDFTNSNHDHKGLKLTMKAPNSPVHSVLLNWNKVQARVDQMLQEQRFLTQAEKDQMAADAPADDIPVSPVPAEETMQPLRLAAQAEYNELKEHHPDHLVGFEQHGYYEFYGEDAKQVASILDSKLLDKELVGGGTVPVTGFRAEAWVAHATLLWKRGMDVYLAGEQPDHTHILTKELLAKDYIPIGAELAIDGRLFRIDSVDFQSDKVSMTDLTFLQGMGFPISRVEPIEFVRSFVEDQSPFVLEDADIIPSAEPEAEPETTVEVVPDVADEVPAIPVEPANFTITDDDLGVGGPKAKFRANIDAIRLLQDLEFDDRLATPEEQEVLSRYVGWGGLADVFDDSKPAWASEYKELKELLSPQEYETARSSVLNAHFTSPVIIRAMYEALGNMGFTRGNVLEPSCGIGNFFGCLPESMAASNLYGVELDSITGRIAKQLYQKANITIDGFERTSYPDDFFDVVIGNVPFGNYQVPDRRYDKHHFQIHDYFIAKSLDQVRPGGVVAVITSSGTMDKQSTATREYLAQCAELVGAIRLPDNAFKKNAGTDVVADILFLQKRDHAPVERPAWIDLGTTADGFTMNQYFVDHPEMVLGELAMEPSPVQKELVASLADRAERIHAGGVDSSIDNMLKVTNDGRKLALDQRLINPMLPENPNSKANACVEKTFEIWQETAADHLTQVIFCDLSTPKADGSFNIYNDIREKLVAKGVPREEIAFIHEANTDAKKAALFAKVRSGQVRVILGSTSKMGAGTNIQDRLVALHHLDVPWRPSDVEQQEGRILRQGNQNKKVKIFRYLTEETFDAYMWQILENKQRFIGQVMTGKSPARSCEDTDEVSLKFAEVKALASGNPLIMEKTELDTALAKLKLLKSSHTSQHYRLEDALLKTYPKEIAEVTALIDGLKADIATAKENLPADPEHFRMTIGGIEYTDRKEAGTAIIAACSGLKAVNTDGIIGEYAGFTLRAQFDSFSQQYKLSIKGKTTHTMEVGPDPAGNTTRVNNAVTGLGKHLEHAEQKLQSLHEKVESAKAEIMRPFPQEEELAAKLARLREVNAMLDMDDKVTDTVPAQEGATVAADRANTTPIARVAIPAAAQTTYADQPRRASVLDRLKANQAAVAAQTKPSPMHSIKKDQTL